MRRPVMVALVAVIAVLAIAAGVLFYNYQKTSTELTVSRTAEEQAGKQYMETIDAIAEIQDSLNAIALGDTGVGAQSWRGRNGQEAAPKGQEALDRIAAVRTSIARSKERIQNLEERIQKSGIKMAGLQRMVANLKTSVAAKEEQVSLLTSRVNLLNNKVTVLATTVQETQDTLASRDRTIEDKRRELATVYYVMGTKKDLKKAGLVESKGGVLGVGKTLRAVPVTNRAEFVALDTDEETVVHIDAPKAKVLTSQPLTSYSLVMVDGKMELHILNPTEFRKIKQLVILTS